ncbi:hypothetical protein [Streptomyces mobaraensis]|uniref:DUF1877 family protein n=1 Tax=Streptomyces mobaraensis TaxID=35621 RepID=A0A5N5W9E8_STRMB|nr:hypothetical protein [Streptomyces mobaraensis]KAB7845038.1 hypothetical protein FRZ00_15130 [Streptomyces mobaraensis]
MSLSVDVFLVREDDGIRVLEVPDGCSDLAGFERWRTTVWGSQAVRSLGARFFPVLAGDDLRVDADQVRAFRRECAVLRENLEDIVAGVNPVTTAGKLLGQLSDRLANIEDAARRAEEVGGGVLIW